ncbi:MAG TPA: SpoIIE family protein phosphatase [Turneriella sp.]|nr:SpoIIE family protein phosphatase [Turneriella sp.]
MAFLSAEFRRSPFFQLSWRLETFTSVIPIPTFVYFIMVTGAFEGEARIWAVGIAGLIAGGGTVAWGLIYRWFALKKLMAELTRLKTLDDAPLADKIKLRHRLLAYPYREGRTIIARWSVGVISGALIYIVQMQEVPFYALFVEAYSLLFVLPISYVMYLFMSESVLRPVLQDPLFAGLPAAGRRIRETSFFTRLLITIASVTITPIAIFGFMLYTTVSGRLSFKHPEVHIVLLSLEALAAIVIVAYRTAKSVRLSIRDTNDVLQQLGKGDFAVNSARATTDEFGRQAELVGAVAHDLSRMYREVNELNETLEQKVEQRTAELNQTLEQVRHLKRHQDGDYFLTTLLLKPLNSNYVKSDRVGVEFFLRQKKDFEFKGVSHDLGGDLCSAHMVRLRDSEYVVFLNADAMGKSMQGAGGALVLGAVFYSIVERTRSVPSMQQLAPERWLKNAFLELDKVFESFDGSMLVSLVLGLVDTQTGLLYYVNAEHPWSILYRGNSASFIENELSLRKLGMSADGRITVRVFEMQPGDVLICGSDGRDDILLHTPDGRPKMNEDEDLILSAVVSAKGELPLVYETCAQRGEITDDYSLLKISYFGDAMPETEKKAMRSASGAYYRAQNYLKAIAEGEKYLSSRPADTQFMRFLSRCHRLAGNYEIAIDLAERLRLRQPDDTRNLTNLAAMHILRGEPARAEQLIAEIRALDAQYPALRKLDELMHRRSRRGR